jgi:hypothetical protein
MRFLASVVFRESTPYENNLGYESGIRSNHENKWEVRILMLLFLSGKFLVSIKTDSTKNIFG